MFKVNNRNTRTRCEICSKLTIKTPERRYFTPYSSVFIINLEQINTGGENVNGFKSAGQVLSFSFVLTVKKGQERGVRVKIISYLFRQ